MNLLFPELVKLWKRQTCLQDLGERRCLDLLLQLLELRQSRSRPQQNLIHPK